MIGGFIVKLSNWKGVFVLLAGYSVLLLLGLERTFHLRETAGQGTSLRLAFIWKTYRTILRHRFFLRCVCINAMAFGLLFAYISEAPFIYKAAGYSAHEIGLTFIPMSIGFLVASQLSRLYYDKFSMDKFVGIAFVCVLLV